MYVIIPELTYVAEMAERLNNTSSVKLGGFPSQRDPCLATLKSCNTTKYPIYGWLLCVCVCMCDENKQKIADE